MFDAFLRIGQSVAGALSHAVSLFNAIPGSFRWIQATLALALVVKYFILPIVGPASVMGGASDQVIAKRNLSRRDITGKRG